MHVPKTPLELAETLQEAASRGRTIGISGNLTKRRMAGPVEKADVCISTNALNGVLEYEPHDLTISVQAGLRWRDLTQRLAEHRQMVPLDPPFAENATVGGVIAANSHGPRRRLYGTARDLVIGMTFATLNGKLVQTGGMVVKNVAGLDMGKVMIGSFGTLAAIAIVNFKLIPCPERERSFLLVFDTLGGAIAARDRIIRGVLTPSAIDLLNPHAAGALGSRGWTLALRAGGNSAALERYERELADISTGVVLEDYRQETLWRHIENLTPRHLERHADGAVVRVSCTLKGVEAVIGSFPGPALARAGSGVCYGYFEQAEAAGAWVSDAVAKGWKAVIEFAPEAKKRALDLWPAPGSDLEIMKRIKNLFDPSNLLNRGRLYRLI
ncbi:MAG TPA: FAD-binding oxidoreductase [Bryobacteraceae bacterium]|nr:FAD-binding oxidoreductase [Bryobacteraceae bacterium]